MFKEWSPLTDWTSFGSLRPEHFSTGGSGSKVDILLPGYLLWLVREIWEKAKGPRASTENDSFRASRNLRSPGVQHFISSLMDEENNEFRSCI